VNPLDPSRAEAVLAEAQGRRVLVVGDLILDTYLWGGVSRISPEAPVPVVRLERESRRIGGAGNVARNLAALGARAEMVGVVGDDDEGRGLRRLMEQAGIDVSGIVADASRHTTGKTRVIAHQQQVVRLDRETAGDLEEGTCARIAGHLRDRIGGCGAVIVEDYEKGVVAEEMMEVLRGEAARAGVPVFVDPKGRAPALYRGARCLTPNRAEAGEMTGSRTGTEEEMDRAAAQILEMAEAEALLLTCGEQGMVLYEGGGGRRTVPALTREVYDVTGAGDTVIAVLGLVAGRDGDLLEAAHLASCAASVVVRHLGTFAPTDDDVLGAVRRIAAGEGAEGG